MVNGLLSRGQTLSPNEPVTARPLRHTLRQDKARDQPRHGYRCHQNRYTLVGERGGAPIKMIRMRDVIAISVPTCLSVFIWKCVDPIHDFIVPNGCSTVWRRRRVFAGFRSSLACTASRTASCSQREIRRSFPVVHLPFSVQPWHALVSVLPSSSLV